MTPEEFARQATKAADSCTIEICQSLWSGYGEISRVRLKGCVTQTVIVKHLNPPGVADCNHPRGWNTNLSRARKLRSYEVEIAFYGRYSQRCDCFCRVAGYLGSTTTGNESFLALEDLDAAGFCERRSLLDDLGVKSCLRWLANFHATFLGRTTDDLMSIGTYWHLATRPDELKAIPARFLGLKECASFVDAKLNKCKFKTIVHGDAKVANFCFVPLVDRFSEVAEDVAVVDFQYCGGGCGMKDVAYFLGSCLTPEQCISGEKRYLRWYFDFLRSGIDRRRAEYESQHTLNFEDLESEWRNLYRYAVTDFLRFVVGWAPEHPKINAYSLRISEEIISEYRNSDEFEHG